MANQDDRSYAKQEMAEFLALLMAKYLTLHVRKAQYLAIVLVLSAYAPCSISATNTSNALPQGGLPSPNLQIAGLDEFFGKIKEGVKDAVDSVSEQIKRQQQNDQSVTKDSTSQENQSVIDTQTPPETVRVPVRKPIPLYGLTQEQNREIQELLTAHGYSPGPADGLPGARTKSAIREYQATAGMPVDGLPSIVLLERLRQSRPLSTTSATFTNPISQNMSVPVAQAQSDINKEKPGSLPEVSEYNQRAINGRDRSGGAAATGSSKGEDTKETPSNTITSSIYRVTSYGDEGWYYVEATPIKGGRPIRREFYRGVDALIPVWEEGEVAFKWIDNYEFMLRVGVCKDEECSDPGNIHYAKFKILPNYIDLVEVDESLRSMPQVSDRHASDTGSPITLRIKLDLGPDGSGSSMYEWLIRRSQIAKLTADYVQKLYFSAPRGSSIKQLTLKTGETVFRADTTFASLDAVPNQMLLYKFTKENGGLFRDKYYLTITDSGYLPWPLALEVTLPGRLDQVFPENPDGKTAQWEVYPGQKRQTRTASSLSWTWSGLRAGSNFADINWLSPERALIGCLVLIALLVSLAWYGWRRGLRLSDLRSYLPRTSEVHQQRFCTKCGAPLSDAQRFCTGCGVILSN